MTTFWISNNFHNFTVHDFPITEFENHSKKSHFSKMQATEILLIFGAKIQIIEKVLFFKHEKWDNFDNLQTLWWRLIFPMHSVNNDDDHIHFAMIFRAVKKEVRLDPFTCTFKKKKLQKEISRNSILVLSTTREKPLMTSTTVKCRVLYSIVPTLICPFSRILTSTRRLVL